MNQVWWGINTVISGEHWHYTLLAVEYGESRIYAFRLKQWKPYVQKIIEAQYTT